MTQTYVRDIIQLQQKRGDKLSYVLKRGKNLYVKFRNRGTPELVENIYEATAFEDKTKCLKRINSIPNSFGTVVPISLEEKIEITKIDKSMSVQEVQEIINKDIKLINGNINCLKEKLSKIELLNIDIEHFIEFNDLNASDGYKIYKILHELRVQRRKIKNQIADMEQMRITVISDIPSIRLKEKQHRAYVCRNYISKPLFEGKISNEYKNICENIRGISQ